MIVEVENQYRMLKKLKLIKSDFVHGDLYESINLERDEE